MVLLPGITGVFDAFIKKIPQGISAGLLAGVQLNFGWGGAGRRLDAWRTLSTFITAIARVASNQGRSGGQSPGSAIDRTCLSARRADQRLFVLPEYAHQNLA